MWSHAWGPFQFGIFPLESLCTRFSQAKLSPPDRVDVPPDRTDHHLDELHDHGRLRLPLHLRDRLHQLHPVHGVHLRRVRRGQANKIFKPFWQMITVHRLHDQMTWFKLGLMMENRSLRISSYQKVTKITLYNCCKQDNVLQRSQDCVQAILLDTH